MMALAAVAMAGCLAVGAGSDRVLAGDLAPAFPAMSALPPETALAPAPAPGVVRVFGAAELRMLAARFRLDGVPPPEICIQRPVAPLSPDRLLEAMQQTLPGARIEILEYSRQAAPQGAIEFPRDRLRKGAAGTLWNGFVRYATGRRFTIWARVNVLLKVHRVLAARDLHPGRLVAAGDVAAVAREEFPAADAFALTPEEVIGRVPRLLIRAGSSIRASQLDCPRDVLRGERVLVEVRDGRASLKLEAQAEGTGSAGQSIAVRNPISGKVFRARVEGKGLVSVNTAPGFIAEKQRKP